MGRARAASEAFAVDGAAPWEEALALVPDGTRLDIGRRRGRVSVSLPLPLPLPPPLPLPLPLARGALARMDATDRDREHARPCCCESEDNEAAATEELRPGCGCEGGAAGAPVTRGGGCGGVWLVGALAAESAVAGVLPAAGPETGDAVIDLRDGGAGRRISLTSLALARVWRVSSTLVDAGDAAHTMVVIAPPESESSRSRVSLDSR